MTKTVNSINLIRRMCAFYCNIKIQHQQQSHTQNRYRQTTKSPQNHWRRNTKFAQRLLYIFMQRTVVKTPSSWVSRWWTRCWVCTNTHIFTWHFTSY